MLAQGLGAEEGVEGLAQGLPAWQKWGNAQNLSPFGPVAAQLWHLFAAIFLLVLLSGGATWCHLPTSLQWLFWACLQGPGLSGLGQPLCQVVGTQE